jgi:lipopolysaccharide export system permease protein
MNHLDRYIGVLTLRIFILAMAGLTILFSLLDFVQQLSLVGQGSYDARDALIYTIFTAPSRVLLLAPVGMLLASLLALGLFARHSELTAWRSLGVSEARIIGALLKLSLPIIFVLFLIAQYVVPTAQLLAQRTQQDALSGAATSLHYGGFWVTSGRQFLNVQNFGFGREPQNIDIYAFADDGSLDRYLHADSAIIQPDGSWLLQNVLEKQVQGTQFVTTQLPTLSWDAIVTRQHMRLLQLPPETMPPVELFRYVHELRRSDQQAVNDELAFWSMVSIPLSLLALVMAAAPFAFDTQRVQSAGRQVLIGALLGIGFELAQQLFFYFGERLSLPPPITALTPSLVLGIIAARALQRTHAMLRRPSQKA